MKIRIQSNGTRQSVCVSWDEPDGTRNGFVVAWVNGASNGKED